jgi:CRP/FNR family transcriptional regulator
VTAVEILGLCPILTVAGDEALRAMSCMAHNRVYEVDEPVVLAGDAGNAVFFLGSGRVKVHRTSENGEETILGFLSPGDLFGELSILDDEPRSADVTAVTRAEVAVLSRDDFWACLDRYPALSRQVLAVQCARLRASDHHLLSVASQDISSRVAARLLDLARRHPSDTPEGPSIAIRLTQGDLAEMVGATRESVNRALGAFKSKGWVRWDRGTVTLLKPEDLRRRAGRV